LPQLEWLPPCGGIGVALADLLFGVNNDVAENSTKAIFLELRKKQLAVGHIVRRHSDFHLFDAKKLV